MPRLADVKLLTIGEFARASRLSPKALRLYDELGLLRPVRVDEYSGYRYYSPDQLEAELVVQPQRLRRQPGRAGELADRQELHVGNPGRCPKGKVKPRVYCL